MKKARSSWTAKMGSRMSSAHVTRVTIMQVESSGQTLIEVRDSRTSRDEDVEKVR